MRPLSPAARWCLIVLGVTVCYFAAGRIGIQWAIVREQISPLWPAAGVALAVPMLLGPRFWPGIFLGALLTNVALGPSLGMVLVISAGNTIGSLLAYAVMRGLGGRNRLDRLPDAVLLVVVGAIGGTAVSAALGTGVLVLDGALGPGDFWTTALVWWTGDAMGVLTITPLLLLAPRFRLPKQVSLIRWGEAAALALFAIGTAILASTTTSKLFLVFPVLVWAALRFRQAGALLCSLCVCTFTIVAAVRELGPYGSSELAARMLHVQAFDATVGLTALVLSTIVLQRDRATAEIADAWRQITEMVDLISARQSLRSAMTQRDDETQAACSSRKRSR
ncbi:Integral membrane sensor domain MASE1 [Amycolatopsis lurida]|uniref:Membrane protein n=1 Tax=Amycolatopsis lurida NRRL 2430 TaxID=1460371 RepID=A0A2P2FXH9_AMYLU|nr:MASE1 domain-containing protein [Amycolatopsis lurida]KFU81412.1 membrane protein [Amycolatopsis lurida NRRL 2430]SEE11616.1 Integral membrane sensor domain MASE1 [Amycolatopsis lurida]